MICSSPGGNNSDISGISSGTEGAETTEGETGLDGERGGEQGGSKVSGDSNVEVGEEESLIDGKKSVFIVPGDIHPNMENRAADIEQLRLLAGKLSADWRVDTGAMAVPALARYVIKLDGIRNMPINSISKILVSQEDP